MKAISLVFSIALSFFAFTSLAAAPNSGEDTQQLRRELARMIDAPQLEQLGMDHTLAFVSFTINEANEIEVEGVAAANDAIEAHIKQELNGRKIKLADLQHGQAYRLKITFRKAR